MAHPRTPPLPAEDCELRDEALLDVEICAKMPGAPPTLACKANKMMLARASPFFRGLFRHGCTEKKSDGTFCEVVSGQTPAVLRNVIVMATQLPLL